MVEKATVDRSSRFKAELEISLFTSMIKNKSDSACLCFTISGTRVTSYVKVAKHFE